MLLTREGRKFRAEFGPGMYVRGVVYNPPMETTL